MCKVSLLRIGDVDRRMRNAAIAIFNFVTNILTIKFSISEGIE